jgi:hypothetical protein
VLLLKKMSQFRVLIITYKAQTYLINIRILCKPVLRSITFGIRISHHVEYGIKWSLIGVLLFYHAGQDASPVPFNILKRRCLYFNI